MRSAVWFRSSHHSLLVFLGTMAVLAAALTWLCWRLLEQDRQLENQRTQERLESAADRICEAVTIQLQNLDRWMPYGPAIHHDPPPGSLVLLRNTGHEVEVQSREPLLFLPYTSPLPSVNPTEDPFTAVEHTEFRDNNPAEAATYFRVLAWSSRPEIRAGALLRLGRNLRKLGRYREALDVYGELRLLPNTAVEGIPAELIALDARCRLMESLGWRDELRREAGLMESGLRSCRWKLSAAVWESHRQQVRQWTGSGELSNDERRALALARTAEWVYRLGQRPPEPKGRRLLRFENCSTLVSWSASDGSVLAVLAGPEEVTTLWQRATEGKRVHAALTDLDGQLLLGSAGQGSSRALRSPVAAGLPATLVVTSSDPAAELAGYALHRRFLAAGLAMLGLVLTAGCAFLLYAIRRERAVVRMQSEFVSAVSHEFRTPLTAMRQLSEMLLQERIQGEPDRRRSYEVMFRASQRLQRLVESLLDFGRMEAAAFQYQFADVDIRALVAQVVADFEMQVAPRCQIELRQADTLPVIRADAEALCLALWNLLDNAVKYSPGSPTVWVETRIEGPDVVFAVRDCGMGMEAHEMDQVFERFVRGKAAQRANIKGTGIGLSMARHVVRAHGGEIRLQSAPGAGTTAAILIPIERNS